MVTVKETIPISTNPAQRVEESTRKTVEDILFCIGSGNHFVGKYLLWKQFSDKCAYTKVKIKMF